MGYRRIKRNPPAGGKKTVGHYLKIYFLSLFFGLIIFAIGSFFKPQFTCANSATCKSDLSVSVDNDIVGIFQGHKVVSPKIDLAQTILQSRVLGVHVTGEKKHIYIDLSTQTLYAYEGNTQVMKVLISSGKWGRTPVGNFNIWQKLPVTRMAGGQGADYYNLPNVQWVMYFHNDFGLHGAYWHNNFGHPMSHGCVNMRLVDARELYSWADGPVSGQKGTPVSVCSQFKEPARNASANVAGGPGTCIQDQGIN
jgi:lipoprotein-anchoring transpeptidase ErfK/SrfK